MKKNICKFILFKNKNDFVNPSESSEFEFEITSNHFFVNQIKIFVLCMLCIGQTLNPSLSHKKHLKLSCPFLEEMLLNNALVKRKNGNLR